MIKWPASSYRGWYAMHRAFEHKTYPFRMCRQEGINGSWLETWVVLEEHECFRGFERFELLGCGLLGTPKNKVTRIHWAYSEYEIFVQRRIYLPMLGQRAR